MSALAEALGGVRCEALAPPPRVDELRYHPPGGPWASANRRSFLKTNERSIVLELGREGDFAAKSSGWDENRFVLEGGIVISAKVGHFGPGESVIAAFGRGVATSHLRGQTAFTRIPMNGGIAYARFGTS